MQTGKNFFIRRVRYVGARRFIQECNVNTYECLHTMAGRKA
jgi:hypothetical protein